MRFLDLFAGLGGFNVALRSLGHECVYACDIDPSLQDLYESNFGLRPAGDIRQIDVSEIPDHEVLCAGFPCQPFSKAGSQQGFEHPRWGDLFDYTLRIIDKHKPSFVLLENVPQLEHHRQGRTWRRLEEALRGRDYAVDDHRMSPHQFGIPQIRDRIFIVGSRLPSGLSEFDWPSPESPDLPLSIRSVLDDNPPEARRISKEVELCLGVWQDFLNRFPPDEQLPSFPIWSMEFGATYPYEPATPYAVGDEQLRACLGSHGRSLSALRDNELYAALPSHARTQQEKFPRWKVQFIRQNRDLYARHRRWIDDWLPSVLEFPSSLQKFEWNCKGEERDIWRYVIQFRPSGVRVKRPTTAPSLVAMTSTQVPIIAWEKRYLTPREGARLQSLGDDVQLPASQSRAFEALGNAVNADLVRLIAQALLATASSSPPLADAS